MKKSELLRALQTEIGRHDFSYFVDSGVTVPGCSVCRKRINTHEPVHRTHLPRRVAAADQQAVLQTKFESFGVESSAPGGSMKPAIGICLILSAGIVAAVLAQQPPPSISFGSVSVSLGMTKDKLEQSVAGSAWHLQPLQNYKESMIIEPNSGGSPSGQVVFDGDRIAYIDYQFATARNATELAQEVAGAVEEMNVKSCLIQNYSSRGTGGGLSESIFDCGAKRFSIMTVESLGSDARNTNVHIELGAIPTAHK